jgi:hypothetical protein
MEYGGGRLDGHRRQLPVARTLGQVRDRATDTGRRTMGLRGIVLWMLLAPDHNQRPSRGRLQATLCLLTVVGACGGGGGGGATPPVSPPLVLRLTDGEIATSEPSSSMAVTLQQPASGPPAVLLEFLVTVDPPIAEPVPGVDAVQALVAVPTSESGPTSAGYRVLFGHGEDASSAPLPDGDLLRLWLQPTQPRTSGQATVTLSLLRAADEDGNAVPIEPPVALGTLEVR